MLLLIVTTACLAGIMILAGCSDDDPVTVGIYSPGPASLGELVLQIKDSYEARDPAMYQSLLDPDYLTLLSGETIQEFPTLGTTLDFDQEERIHGRMFSDESLVDPIGTPIPGVLDIRFLVFLARDVWLPTDEGVLFPGAVWAPFEVQILFDRGQSYPSMRVEGVVKIYARAHEVTVGGTQCTYYLMAGMRDLTGYVKGSEVTPWGSVKAIYR